MSLKRILSAAVLLLLAAVPSAFAATFHNPTFGADYVCQYVNPPYPRVDGLSTFVLQSTQWDADRNPIYRTIEYFDAKIGGTFFVENNKATFAKPVNTVIGAQILYTRWEFTLLNGPQCKRTDVSNWGGTIVFDGCTDGHRRTCQRLY